MKDQDAAHDLEQKFVEEKEQDKPKDGPAPPPASLIDWQELPSGIGALKTVELIGMALHRVLAAAWLPLLLRLWFGCFVQRGCAKRLGSMNY